MNNFSFAEYAERAESTAQYPGRGDINGLFYVCLGLGGESGEVLDEAKKSWRNDGVVTDKRRERMLEECGDVLWYIAGIVRELDASLEEVALANIVKLAARARKNQLKEHS